MSLVRSWLSGTARALGVSILVPLVLVGVLLGATVGGVGGLRSLRQLVAGPAIPNDRPALAQGASAAPRPTTTLPTIPSAAAVLVSGNERAGQRGRTRNGTEREATRSPGTRRRTPGSGVSPTPATGTQPPPSGSETPRQHPLRAVRNLGERVRRTVEPLPAPIGPTASDAIETVLDIVDPPNKKTGTSVLGRHGG